MTDRQKIADWLFKAMKQNKKTVSDVTNMTDICDERIRGYLMGVADFDLTELKKLSRCLNQSLPI